MGSREGGEGRQGRIARILNLGALPEKCEFPPSCAQIQRSDPPGRQGHIQLELRSSCPHRWATHLPPNQSPQGPLLYYTQCLCLYITSLRTEDSEGHCHFASSTWRLCPKVLRQAAVSAMRAGTRFIFDCIPGT